jgi:hypothetical protein
MINYIREDETGYETEEQMKEEEKALQKFIDAFNDGKGYMPAGIWDELDELYSEKTKGEYIACRADWAIKEEKLDTSLDLSKM